MYRYQFRTDKSKKAVNVRYKIKAKVWIYSGNGAWYFVTLPRSTSKEIKGRFGLSARGWGSLPVTVGLGRSRWKTSIFPYKKVGAYILPLKADIRKKENVRKNKSIEFCLSF